MEQQSTLTTFIELVIAVLYVVAYWKIFVKANEAGWKSLIPFYNAYTEFKLFWGNGWFFLLLLIPIVDIVIYVMFSLKLAKSFGKGTGFAIGLIFLPTIFYLILGFGKDEYIGPNGEAAAPVEEKKEEAKAE